MKVYRQTFQVTGLGSFPLDMLRYDECYPRTERDTALIDQSFQEANVQYIGLERILTDEAKDPTFDRWKSFLWAVVKNSIVTEQIK
ncbi:MAG: hypothetical protein XU15_C0011G0096 [candidate division NC10 bacterium CSP1-5]|nr:MAG: hypothetical protein XU15_C0011G0096 [candidate division NC10 bacterium CSP1-5]